MDTSELQPSKALSRICVSPTGSSTFPAESTASQKDSQQVDAAGGHAGCVTQVAVEAEAAMGSCAPAAEQSTSVAGSVLPEHMPTMSSQQVGLASLQMYVWRSMPSIHWLSSQRQSAILQRCAQIVPSLVIDKPLPVLVETMAASSTEIHSFSRMYCMVPLCIP